MPHIILLGDSIFDNAAYVAGGPDVLAHMRELMPTEWRTSFRAVDGAYIANVPGQLSDLPDDATHLVVSAGGNDALGCIDLLERPASSFAEVREPDRAVGAGRAEDRACHPGGGDRSTAQPDALNRCHIAHVVGNGPLILYSQ